MNRAIESPMNRVDARRAFQILRHMERFHKVSLGAILENLDLGVEDFTSVQDALMDCFSPDLECCGGCGARHVKDFAGDCRDDDERF